MCGIVGFLTSRVADIPETQTLSAMRDILHHRGPDDSGEYIRPIDERGPFIFFGHRRLSIIDISGGHQPISNEDKTVWVIFNGEIYNFIELKKKLEKHGHRFETNSDTEVIVHAYEEFGEECFQLFNGMFAVGIWDEKKTKLILARDRLGKKPLYYSWVNETFIFASELKALMTYPNFPRRVETLSFMKYLFFEYVPAPHTIFKDAMKLPPSSYLVWTKKGAGIKTYWSPFHSEGRQKYLSEEEIVERLIFLLKRSVKRRLISDVPLGVFLSGGIDSSTITAFAQQESPGKIKTFSIGFEDPSFDESKYALLVSQYLGTEHHEQVMTPSDLLRIVPNLPEILDEPMADASILPTYLLSKFTREHVKVALGGDGGDELFAGYPTYLAHRWAKPYERLLGSIHPIICFLVNLLPVSDDNISFDFKVKKFLSGIGYPDGIRNALWLGSFSFPELRNVLSPDLASLLDPTRLAEEISSYKREFPLNDPVGLLQYLDLRLYLQEDILVKVDRASMACSLEIRAPFLDHEFVEFVVGLPSNVKLRGVTSKYILRKSMAKVLPQEVIGRKKKGFGVPIAKWAKRSLKELFEDVLAPERIKKEGFLNPQSVTTLFHDHLSNKKDNRKQLWTLLVWQLWLNRYQAML